jgi:peptidoglycan hydrolase-like protein with peptidoglycan-binding domain
MNKLAVMTCVFALVFALNAVSVQPVQAQSSGDNLATLAQTLKDLLAKVADLQKQIAATRSDVQEVKKETREALKANLKEGMTDADIKKVQELLATDKEIYPEGLATGYFGNLTKNALMRFQEKHNLSKTGTLDTQTKDLLEEYLNERFDGNTPTGLWRAPGIFKKVHDRICDRSGKGGSFGVWGLFCKDWSSDDKDEDEETTQFDINITVANGKTTVAWSYNSKQYTTVVSSVQEGRVLTAVARKMKISMLRLDKDFVAEIKKGLKDAIESENPGNEEDAKDAIEEAEDEIDEVQSDINDAGDDVDTDEAQEALDKAKVLLEEAEDAFDDDNFSKAKTLAIKALKKAEEAAELLEEAIEDAE